MIREPAVAGSFYPGDPLALKQALKLLIPESLGNTSALAVVSPHAGYVYSGAVAGETFAEIKIPQDIVLIGPNHHGHGAPLALMDSGFWATPLGEVPINRELSAALLKASPLISSDKFAHKFEHSLEVQIPFIQYLRPDVTITPLVVSHVSLAVCQETGEALAQAIKQYDRQVLIVASSDMTHYETRESASRKDQSAMTRILALDPVGLYYTVLDKKISMCGFIPTTIMLFAARKLGASLARLVRYADSGQVNGDATKVVGYAGFVIS